MKPAEEMRLRCWGVVMVREAAIEKVTDRVEVILPAFVLHFLMIAGDSFLRRNSG